MKLLTATTLALSLCVGTVLPVAAENIVGTVKAWQYMQADGWKSADGLDNHTLSNALYGARVIDNYPLDPAIPATSGIQWRLFSGR